MEIFVALDPVCLKVERHRIAEARFASGANVGEQVNLPAHPRHGEEVEAVAIAYGGDVPTDTLDNPFAAQQRCAVRFRADLRIEKDAAS